MSRDKSAKFTELATKRVNRVIKDLQLISNLANRQNYSYTEEQARKIIRTLKCEVQLVEQKFHAIDDSSRKSFKL